MAVNKQIKRKAMTKEEKLEKRLDELNMTFKFNGDCIIKGKKQSKFMSSYYHKQCRKYLNGEIKNFPS